MRSCMDDRRRGLLVIAPGCSVAFAFKMGLSHRSFRACRRPGLAVVVNGLRKGVTAIQICGMVNSLYSETPHQ